MGGLKKDNAPINITFARIMRICTWVGLIILFVFGVLYFSGINGEYDASLIMRNWDKPVTRFWLSVRGQEARGYAWFLSHLWGMDSLAMIGILLLALTPLIALLFIIWRMKGLYLILLLVLVVEFLFSVFLPLL
jgi:hypothetical protein